MENPERQIHENVISWRVWFCYGIGHVLNDICASIWFTYLLVFFNLVLHFDSISSGIILLIGQVADALSTPFVGIESDRNNTFWFFKYGKRKTWHLIGTVCILSSFPFIFTPCIGCKNAHVYAQMIYYAAFVIIFQFGWAAVQISHLALIPELTPDENQRTQLTAIRYGFTVASTIFIYVVTWVSLKSGSESDRSPEVGSNDAVYFQRPVYMGLCIGFLTSLAFHWGVEENSEWNQQNRRRNQKTVSQFLKDRNFYQVALVYMSSRLFVNTAQVYLPFYLQETFLKKFENLALIPLLMYIGSIGATLGVHRLNKNFGRKVAYAFGFVTSISACIWIKIGNHNDYKIYIISILLGVSASILIVTALGLTADLIGFDTDSGASVYGGMSFVDKLSNGISVMIIQSVKYTSPPNFYQNVLIYVCGGAATLGMISIFGLKSLSKKKDFGAVDERKSLLLGRRVIANERSRR